LTVGVVWTDEHMAQLIPTALALLAVGLIGVALVLMSGNRLGFAGASFLSASIVIYLRARWIQRNRSGAD
jgi:nitrate/nitrite transporter NarK